MTDLREVIKEIEASNKAESLIIKSLDLSGKQIGDNEIKTLIESIKNSTSLNHLDLSNNEITDAGAIALAEMLKSNYSLLSLKLKKNRIGKEGLKTISRALLTNKNLGAIFLDGNQPIYEESYKIGEWLEIKSNIASSNNLKIFLIDKENSHSPFIEIGVSRVEGITINLVSGKDIQGVDKVTYINL